MAAIAHAQEETRPITLETLTLTAESEATASPTPQTHLDAGQIARSQGASVAQVLQGVPGVTSSNGDNLLVSTPAIRGFGAGKHLANDPNVLVTMDGVSGDGGRIYQNASGMVADPVLLKSIDVLKGPLASLQYGSGVAGGTIAVRTIDASDLTGGKPGFRFRQLLGASSNGSGWVTSSTLAWQPGENLEFLANYSRNRLDRQEDGDGQEIALDGYNLPSHLLKARYTFGEAGEHRLSFSHARNSTAERDVPYGQMTGTDVFGNVNRDRTGTVTIAGWEWTPADNPLLAVELQASHSSQDTDITFLLGSPFGSMFGGQYNLKTDKLTLKNTARFQTGAVDHRLVAGVDYSRQTRDNVTMLNPAGTIRRLGVFVIDEMDLGDGLNLTGGLRIERQKIDGQIYAGPFGPADAGPYTTTARSGGFGVSKEFGPGFTAFGSLAYGEGLATLDVLGSTTTVGGIPYADRTEKSRSWEGGLKWANADLGGGLAAAFQLTAYRIELWDVNTGVSRGAEIGRLKKSGIEAEGQLRLASGPYAKAGLSITDNDEAVVSPAGVESWQDFGYSPADNGFLTLGMAWTNGLDVSGTLRGARAITINGTDSAGYGVTDLKVSYAPIEGALAGVTVDFGIENVFDKTYRSNTAYFNEPGRNLKLTLAKTF